MYMICEAMEWNHLPVAGGIYDQHPALLDDFMQIFQAKSTYEREQAKKKEAEAKRKKPRGR